MKRIIILFFLRDAAEINKLYLFGAAMQLKRMDYHMTKMN